MILDEIVLHNFGVYKDRQSIELSPPSNRKPVVLFGGLNGVGKTTLLDALQLGLYGKNARCSNRGALAYEDYLRKCIHHSVSVKDGAAIEVQFREVSNGKEQVWRVHRSWSQNGKGLKEHVEVLHNNECDSVFAELWDDTIHELLPPSISHLFFFDGEKIESFADLDNSSKVLSTAIQSLLGLDLVDQLTGDLLVLERRKKVSLKDASEREEIDAAESELQKLEERESVLKQKRASAENDLQRLQKQLSELDAQFQAEGGDLYEQRERLESDRKGVEQHLRDASDALREFSAGAAPLFLVKDLIADIIVQDDLEQIANQTQRTVGLLEERDSQLLDAATRNKTAKGTLKMLEKFLADDRERRAQQADQDCYLDLERVTGNLITSLPESVFPALSKEIPVLLSKISNYERELDDIDRRLTRVPERDSVSDVIESRHKTQLQLEDCSARIRAIDSELEQLQREIAQKRSRLVGIIEKNVKSDFGREDVARILTHSARVRKTMEKFRISVVARHTSRIAQLVLESFRQLLRKKSLVTSLTIHPETFMMELRDSNDRVISPDRLSAGERQLLAVSTLWGLARASGRPLPAVIDTPLGRLDSSHRMHLVERYFPSASHQVILLSTDEEIDQKYFEKLRPYVGRTYRLDFDESTQSTEVHAGYFWD